MSKEQADALAAHIKAQFAGAYVQVFESSEKRNAPRNWFVAVSRSYTDANPSIILHSELDWRDALNAHSVLKALE